MVFYFATRLYILVAFDVIVIIVCTCSLLPFGECVSETDLSFIWCMP